ncbi:retrovirus-related pol polyprotein from transposon TNT 1-94 [Tanacetum coccineum]
MDSIIPLGQKNTLAEYMILSGADNHPPMLDKSCFAVHVFSLGDDLIAFLGETMQVDRQGLLNATTVKVKDIWLGNALSLSDQGMQHGVPDSQAVQTIIPNNAAFQTVDLDTYDSDYDDIVNAKAVLMANISNYRILTNPVVDAQQDLMFLSVLEQMINHVNNWEEANKEQNNESVTAELERYKERVKTFEQRLNINLSSREKMFDSQIDDMIKEKLALKNKEAHIDYLKYTQEQANILWGIVKQAKAKQPLDNALDFACSSKKAKIVESKNANHSEPNHTWGSNATDIPSSSSLVMTVRIGNNHIARIMGYGDSQLGNVTISRVYYVEGLRHNLFSVGQFCDADLEVAFQKNTCFIHNLEGVDLLYGSRDTNLYTISLEDMLKTSPICLLSKVSKTKSWLWHCQLSHLNCGTLNKLAKDGLARGIPRLKFQKDHLYLACALGKSKKSSHQPKAEDTNQETLYLLHMDFCVSRCVWRVIMGKTLYLCDVDDYS